jgi:hypothetical protein
MIDFSKCPNCQTKWNPFPRTICSQCKLILHEGITLKCVYAYVGNYEIWWRSDGSISVFLDGKVENEILRSTELTLPYDITLQQLKLYLTFS